MLECGGNGADCVVCVVNAVTVALTVSALATCFVVLWFIVAVVVTGAVFLRCVSAEEAL